MLHLLWKVPLFVALVLLATTTALVTRARLCAPASCERPAVTLGPDGLHDAKREARQAVATAAVRRAVEEFVASEGRLPADLDELARSGYFAESSAMPDLRRYRYDCSTGAVTCTLP